MRDEMSGRAEPVALLTVDTVGAYVIRRGLIPDGIEAPAVSLGGGVSNVVLAVDAGDRHVVVKQAVLATVVIRATKLLFLSHG